MTEHKWLGQFSYMPKHLRMEQIKHHSNKECPNIEEGMFMIFALLSVEKAPSKLRNYFLYHANKPCSKSMIADKCLYIQWI